MAYRKEQEVEKAYRMEGVQAYMHLLQERQDTVLGVEPYLDKEVQGLVLHILHILHIQVPLEEDP